MSRKIRVGACAIASALVSLATVAGAEGYDPYEVSREKFRADVKTIALRPVRLALEEVDGEALASQMLEQIGNRLREKGYTVVEADEFTHRWRAYSETLGGIYDTQTGKPDAENLELTWEYTARELSTELDVDAVLRPTLFSRAAKVSWSGGKMTALAEQLTWGGELIDWAEGLPNWPQIVNGLWFSLDIDSIERVDLYGVGCPIRWSAIYMARGLQVRPESEVYEPSEVFAAIERCLEDLEAR